MKILRLFLGFGILALSAVSVTPVFTAEEIKSNGDIYVDDMTANPAADKQGTVSLDFENADLKNVLKAFSMQTGINFIASDVIENKKITVFLSNVSIDSALVAILEANGLLYDKQAGNVYLIKPTGKGNIKTITRIFRLNYLQAYKMAEASASISSSSAISIIMPSSASGESTTTSGTTGGTGSSSGTQEKSISDIIKSLMSKYGTLVADRRNNCLIITDIPDVFESIEETISKLDVAPVQIMIQAEIIETTTSALKRIGVEYGSEAQLAKVTYTGTSSTSGGASNATNPTFPTPFPFTENFIKQAYGTDLTHAGFAYGTLRVADTEIVLKLLAMDSDTKYLSRPKIMTLNNETAVIKVSANTAIGTNNTSVSTTGQSISTAERAETGVVLKVTPQVNENGDIFMFIEPSVSRAVPSTLSASFYDPSYRQSNSTVMVRDLETIVVAGLIQTNNYKTTRKIPFLGDIPIIGEPFKSHYTKVEDTELMIFVTPHIIRPRDPEFVTLQNEGDRDYVIEKAMEKYSDRLERPNGKNEKTLTVSKEAVMRREDAVSKALQKYSGVTGAVQQK